jgi:enoyl-CoA hydratase
LKRIVKNESDSYFAKYPGLRFERREHGILWMTLDRPEKGNAADHAMHRSLSRVWLDIDDDPETSVVVVTGAGDVFSAGGDLEWLDSMVGDYPAMREGMREGGDLVSRILSCEKVIVSAINGSAVGAGLVVALMADISIISEDARLADGHTRIGVAAGDHANICWPLLCGLAKAKYYLITSEFLDGKEAERIGLVSKAVPSGSLYEEAMRIAVGIATGSQDAARLTKRALNLWMRQATPAFDAALAFEMLNFMGPDARAAVDGMRAKRRIEYPSGAQ